MGLLDLFAEACAACSGNPPVPGSGAGAAGAAAGAAGGGAGDDVLAPPTGKDLAQGIVEGAALDTAMNSADKIGSTVGGSGGPMGILGPLLTIANGSEQGAKGYIAIKRSKGRGLGGGSNAADQAMDQIARDRANNEELARQMGHR